MPDHPPRVTVLMPTYNRPDCLAGAVESVRAQAFEDWELLVFNDGGADVGAYLLSLKDDRIHYIPGRNNRGKSARLNQGIQRARGEFIAYLDDDDLWYPNHLAVLVEALEKRPDAGAAYADAYDVVYVRHPDGGPRHPVDKQVRVARDFCRDYLFFSNNIRHSQAAHRQEVLLRAGGYNEKVNVLIDWHMNRKLAFLTNFVRVPIVTGEYWLTRHHSDQISRVKNQEGPDYRWNFRLILADHPPGPWPYVETVAVIYPVPAWTPARAAHILSLLDSLYYPVSLVIADMDPEGWGARTDTDMARVLTLPNVERLALPGETSVLNAYRAAAERTGAEFVHLVTDRMETGLPRRLAAGLDFLKASGADAVRWDVPAERDGPYDVMLRREVFLEQCDMETGRIRVTPAIVPQRPPDALMADAVFNTAVELSDAGRFAEALEAFERLETLTRRQGWEIGVTDRLAPILFALGRYERAESLLRNRVARGCGGNDRVGLGRALQALGRYEEAGAQYERGVAEIGFDPIGLKDPVFPFTFGYEPGVVRGLTGLADCYYRLGRIPEAERLYSWAVMTQADAVRPRLGLAGVWLDRGQPDRAEGVLLETARLAPQEYETFLLLAELCMKREMYDQARSFYLHAHDLGCRSTDLLQGLFRLANGNVSEGESGGSGEWP